ncbi:hypothetical protein A3A79_04505 [Candidatus Gottesmanbacteria bacterium RIFCSPLOWO2_01_FULL_43_11b]|nr:MAG: hypothetical protein A3A79_04505 [Candidatus Gottesmanbacteria bacterium RIFCSPLOWO2_01_FULL_43_11b]
MSKAKIIFKNISLSEKFSLYYLDNPNLFVDFPNNASIVIFSKSDNELNKSNDKILKDLIQEGTEVVKVQETSDQNTPWRFSSP